MVGAAEAAAESDLTCSSTVVACEHPHTNSCLSKRFDGLLYVVLQLVSNSSHTEWEEAFFDSFALLIHALFSVFDGSTGGIEADEPLLE